jgi:hypothetical protein
MSFETNVAECAHPQEERQPGGTPRMGSHQRQCFSEATIHRQNPLERRVTHR